MMIHEALRFAHDRDEVYAILEQALARLPGTERCHDAGDEPPRSVDEVQSLFSHLFHRLDHASRVLNEPTCRALKDAIQSCGIALQRLHALESDRPGSPRPTLPLETSPVAAVWPRAARGASDAKPRQQVTSV